MERGGYKMERETRVKREREREIQLVFLQSGGLEERENQGPMFGNSNGLGFPTADFEPIPSCF